MANNLKHLSIEDLAEMLKNNRTTMLSKESVYFVTDFLDRGETQYQIVNKFGCIIDYSDKQPNNLKELSPRERQELFNVNNDIYYNIINELIHKHGWDKLSERDGLRKVYKKYIEPFI